MVNIIKQGKKPKPKRTIYKITCPYCGCVFECETEDLLSIERTPGGKRTVKCPCCDMVLNIASLDNITIREEEIIDE